MISRHIVAFARLRIARIRPRPTTDISSLLLVARCDRTCKAPCVSVLRPSFARRVHTDVADMSSSTQPADSPSGPGCPLSASSSVSEGSMVAKEEERGDEKERQKNEKKLAPLKGAEFRAYNRLAEHMDLFHAHFRTSWNALWAAACAGNSSKSKTSSRSGRSIINDGLAFIAQLEVHHNIEETYIFPILAQRMPEFRTDGKGGKDAAELLRQHHEIHEGMEGMRKYLRSCRDGEQDLDMHTLKAQMETWGSVLWTHLDQEVQTLGAENMRKYWTAEEIRRIPM